MKGKTVDQRIEELAIMIAKGFMESKEDLVQLRLELKTDIREVVQRLEDKVDIVLMDHEHRLKVLESHLN